MLKLLVPLCAGVSIAFLTGCTQPKDRPMSPRAERLLGKWTLKSVEGKDVSAYHIKDIHLTFGNDGWFEYTVHLDAALASTEYQGEGKWELNNDVLVNKVGPNQSQTIITLFSMASDRLTLSPDPILHPSGRPKVTSVYIRTPRFE